MNGHSGHSALREDVMPQIFERDYKGKLDGRDILSKFFLEGKI